MARIEKFEDLVSWQKARALTQRVYRATKSGGFAKDFGLRDQIRRASVSILSNIPEGFERGGDKEFQQFLSVAKGSCAEVRAQLYVALDESYIEPKEFEELEALTVEISRLISGMMTYLASSVVAGRKFKPATASRPKTSDSRLSRL
jgi:four helix bundle protein